MHIRRKRNRSGTTSVVVVDKSDGYTELKTIGVSSDPAEIRELCIRGKEWIDEFSGQQPLDFNNAALTERQAAELLDSIESVYINGMELLVSKAFTAIGFDAVQDRILKALVIARLAFPSSKKATSEYLLSYFGEDLHRNRIYRYLDRLHATEKERVETISTEHTRKILGGTLGVVFYDVTTLYFETDSEDGLRKPGWSKDGKHSNPQIILGLLVSKGGYPLSYTIHEGNTYEGNTMLPLIKAFAEKHRLEDLVVVADSGLLNASNMDELDRLGYKYILGARIKNSRKETRDKIFRCPRTEGASLDIPLEGKRRLLVTWSAARARKDAYNRDKGVRRLEKSYSRGRISKEQVNRRGYNKFLDISKDIGVSINYSRIDEDARWDGLKGYVTNSDLPTRQVLEAYSNLWRIENAFRISKSTLDIRPIFHFTRKRIEAHICLCFKPLKVYKELERRLAMAGISQSVDKVIGIAKTITTVSVRVKGSGKTLSKTMLLTPEQKSIAHLLEDAFWEAQ